MEGEVIVVILLSIATFVFFYVLSTWLFAVPSYLRRIAEALEKEEYGCRCVISKKEVKR